MVRVIHEHNDQRVAGDTAEGPGLFLLTNKKGGYCALCPGKNVTKYNGVYNYDAEQKSYVKTIENLVLPSQQLSKVVNRLHTVERHYTIGAVETFRLSSSALHYDLTGWHGELYLDFDVRRTGDHDPEGRKYTVRHEDGRLIITFEKRYGFEGEKLAYAYTVVVEGVDDFTLIDEWQPRFYAYDARRGDGGEGWVYRAGAVNVNGDLSLTITRSTTEKKALEKATYARDHAAEFFESNAAYAKNAFKQSSIQANVALAALDSLTVKLKGQEDSRIIAGLPWFTETWSRDELISSGALITAKQYGLVKHVLIRYFELLAEKPGLDAHYPSGGLIAADSLGWLAKRTHDLLRSLKADGVQDEYFTRLELAYLRDRLGNAVKRLLEQRGKDGMVVNGPGETWMDAVYAGDARGGIRVEIQALQLATYKLLAYLDQQTLPLALQPLHSLQQWKRREKELAKKARTLLFHDGRLADGLKNEALDRTTRPNVFIALYVYPELLSAQEWITVCDNALERLWLPWGGLSTIEKGHPLYRPRYTGVNDQSYHRGDSWYWVNALAAITLRRLDPQRYQRQVSLLREACVQDLLFQGAYGHASELSSAESQEWGGTFAQAWSAAMLAELLLEESS